MTTEEIKTLIQFKSEPVTFSANRTTARFCVTAEIIHSTMGMNDVTRDYIHDELRYKILRFLFEDQRKELREALYDLLKASPMDYVAMRDAQERLMAAARFQPDKGYKLQEANEPS